MTEDTIENLNCEILIQTSKQAHKTKMQMSKFCSNEEKLNEYTFLPNSFWDRSFRIS
jgi:hypothetical protein